MIRRQDFHARCDMFQCTAQAVEEIFSGEIRVGQYCGFHVEHAMAEVTAEASAQAQNVSTPIDEIIEIKE